MKKEYAGRPITITDGDYSCLPLEIGRRLGGSAWGKSYRVNTLGAIQEENIEFSDSLKKLNKINPKGDGAWS